MGAALLAGCLAGPAAGVPVRTVSLEVEYRVNVSEDNHDTWNETFCRMAGHYHAVLNGDVAVGTVRLPLQSGAHAEVTGAQQMAGDWDRDGTAAVVDVGGANCEVPLKRIDCTGQLTSETKKPTIVVVVEGGTVGIAATAGGEFVEKGAASCGSHIQLPGPSIIGVLNNGFGAAYSAIPLVELARLQTGHWVGLETPKQKDLPPADCSDHDRNHVCKASYSVRMHRIWIRVVASG